MLRSLVGSEMCIRDSERWGEMADEEEVVMLRDISEVCSRLYLGSLDAAASLQVLGKCGITHVLTVADNLAPLFPDQLCYKVVSVQDDLQAQLIPEFSECFSFIDDARAAGAVLVHCEVSAPVDMMTISPLGWCVEVCDGCGGLLDAATRPKPRGGVITSHASAPVCGPEPQLYGTASIVCADAREGRVRCPQRLQHDVALRNTKEQVCHRADSCHDCHQSDSINHGTS
eukprot:TRINITY_DN7666_c0_g1_i2.p1 TRINITY_DN7666_c0_g1~~TRINITY_DN7666_c0_g1_i2.p1  ORF type:complete len:229 (+),score=27.21 TRINITY_DN7666_c0_g1_i2:116-802(+)